mgnify:CR=1 FL=1
MIDISTILQSCRNGQVVRMFSALLGVSLVLLIDILLIIQAAFIWGGYLVMALVAGSSLIFLLLALYSLVYSSRTLRRKIRQGIYPENEFAAVNSILIAAVFFLIPGFITSCIGIILLLPPFRTIIGRAVNSKRKTRLQETYEFLKIQEYSN